MDLYILDSEFNSIMILDVYESFIWTDRYDEYGDFEAYFSPHEEILQYMVAGNYIWRKDSEHLMMIKEIEIKTDPVDGDHAIVTGESLESILKNRVIAEQTILSGSLQNGIKTLLDQTIINPSDRNRRISNFIFKETDDPAITKLTLEAQYWGENLYDIVADVCYSEHIGFKVTLNDDNQFVFELYKGVDRTYEQDEYPYIVFSHRYENLLNSDYIYNIDNVRNVAYILGEEPEEPQDVLDEEGNVIEPAGEPEEQIVEMTGEGTGLNRKEIFVDGSSITRVYRDDEGEKVEIPEDEYRAQLRQRGTEELAEYFAEETFDGQIQDGYQWILGKDYFMGDIVQVENQYGKSAKCRIVEMIASEDASGTAFYPSFETDKDSNSEKSPE